MFNGSLGANDSNLDTINIMHVIDNRFAGSCANQSE